MLIVYEMKCHLEIEHCSTLTFVKLNGKITLKTTSKAFDVLFATNGSKLCHNLALPLTGNCISQERFVILYQLSIVTAVFYFVPCRLYLIRLILYVCFFVGIMLLFKNLVLPSFGLGIFVFLFEFLSYESGHQWIREP